MSTDNENTVLITINGVNVYADSVELSTSLDPVPGCDPVSSGFKLKPELDISLSDEQAHRLRQGLQCGPDAQEQVRELSRSVRRFW